MLIATSDEYKLMLILGIDPGTTTTGYGLVELDINDINGEKIIKSIDTGTLNFKNSTDHFRLIDFGLMETEKNMYAPDKYVLIHNMFVKLIQKHQPDVMAVERIFFASNASTAISVGQAQGVMFLAAANNKLRVVEYAPPTIKKVITGNGRAKKKEVEDKVKKMLENIEGPKLEVDKKRRITKTHIDNAVDAVAIALCHMIHIFDTTLKRHEEVLAGHVNSNQVTIANGKF